MTAVSRRPVRAPDKEQGMGAFTSLKWKRPASLTSINRALRSASARDFLVEKNSSLKSLLSLTGVIAFDARTTMKQRAVQLLKAAAEVEHQFIVQYLYASFCCGLGAAHAADLMTVAQEEMGHLLTVQNLLLMLKADQPEDRPPYLERLRDITTDQEPSPFKIEPLSLPFIARFLVSEFNGDPAVLPSDIGDHLPTGLALRDIHQVGVLYAHLYVLFQSSDSPDGPWNVPLGSNISGMMDVKPLADSDFEDPAVVKAALNPARFWRANTDLSDPDENVLVLPEAATFTDVPTMRKQALNAIHLVAGQGEGLAEAESPEPSHAQRLRAIYDALNNAHQTTAQSLGTDKFPTDPFTGAASGDPEREKNRIDEPIAAAAAVAFDTVYEKLLLCIAQSATETDETARRNAAKTAFQQMTKISVGADGLIAMGRKQGGPNPPDKLAAPPFTFPATGIPNTLAEIKARLDAL